MPTITAPLVGMHYRPPAKAIVEHLPAGAELLLEPEPTNEFDPNAVKVLADPALVPASVHPRFAAALEGYGYTLSETLAAGFTHVGYIARTSAESLCKPITEDITNGEPPRATLGFSPEGKPEVHIHFQSE